MHFPLARRRGFTLVELLVVIGIIGLLISLLLPSLNKASKQARQVTCQSNLRVAGQVMVMYMNDNRGILFPVGARSASGLPTTLGTNVAPHERWPMKMPFGWTFPATPPYNLETPYTDNPGGDPVAFMAMWPAEPFTPKVLRCPEDENPYEAHSYVVNQHLADREIKYSSRSSKLGGLTVSELVVMGEKKTNERDYHMESSDFGRVVEPYRHGIKLGSNYLYLDMHVGTELPNKAKTGIDPWSPNTPTPVDPPTTPTGG